MAFLGKRALLYFAVATVLLSMFTPEVEGRRNVLRGRKTVTRRYLTPMAIPAWAIIILVGVGQLVIGAVIYVILKKTIVDTETSASYSVAPLSDA
ncbi:uncharacterized protein LOC126747315 [Anthonomus grandis grandis]|uniref:uncharacterized protein LOC126747315 n=1 Tax=Anthonomus grandis grandis TaxID=2921223 RepID=UPI0021662C1B|nr:uncharacterized protein LOC126747315 [Anthonomus grandis grandis]